MAITKGVGATIAVPMVDAADPANLKSGLTLTCQRSYDGDGAFAACTNAAVENGATGIYKLTLTAAEMNHETVAVMATAAGACDQVLVLVTDEVSFVRAKTDLLGSRGLVYTGGVDPESGTVKVLQGDTLSIALGTSLPFDWPDPSHALGLDDPGTVVSFISLEAMWVAASVVSTAAGYHLEIEATSAETALLTERRQLYELEAVFPGGETASRKGGWLVLSYDVAGPVHGQS